MMLTRRERRAPFHNYIATLVEENKRGSIDPIKSTGCPYIRQCAIYASFPYLHMPVLYGEEACMPKLCRNKSKANTQDTNPIVRSRIKGI